MEKDLPGDVLRPPPGGWAAPALPAGRRARVEAWQSTHGLAALVLGVGLVVAAALWWCGAFHEFGLRHGAGPTPVWQRWPLSVARGFGLVLNFFGVLVLLLSCRFLLTRLRSTAASAFLPIDGAMPLSVAVVGYAMAALSVVHGVCHLVGGLTPGAPAVGWSSGWTGWTRAVVTGGVALALLGTMVVTSLPAVRQRHFELFYAANKGGGALFFLALLLHGSWGGHFTTWKWLVAPLLIHAVDVGGRVAATRRGTAALSFASGDVVFVSPDVLRLALPRVFDYRPGQYAEVRVPLAGGGPLGWHPFTIASAPHEEQMVFFIKVAGDWTHRLHTLVELARREGDEGLEVHVRGPFGAPASCTASYERVLLVGGGVGCTPFISVAKSAEKILRETRGVGLPRSGSAADGAGGDDGVNGPCVDCSPLPAGISKVGMSFMADARPQAGGRDASGTSGTRTTGDTPVTIDTPVSEADADSFRLSTALKRPIDAAAARRPTGLCARYPGLCSPTSDAAVGISRSITVSATILWVLLARVALFAFAGATDEAHMWRTASLSQYTYRGVILADVVLAALAAALVLGCLITELFSRTDGAWHAAALAPVLAALTISGALPAAALAGSVNATGAPVGYIQALLLMPIPFAAVLTRHLVLLSTRLKFLDPTAAALGAGGRLRSADFVWTSPTAADDEWVVRELAPLVDSCGYVRVHRFGTREAPPGAEPRGGADDDGGASESSSDGGHDRRSSARWDAATATRGAQRVSLNYGRPRWSALLDALVAHSRSGSVVGVFFCGARGMEAAVRAAASAAMTESRRRGMIARVPEGGGGVDAETAYGHNVRIVVRSEIF